MKTNSSDAIQSKHTFESLYISTRLGVLHPPRGMNIKEKKLTRYDFPCTKNDQSIPLG